MQEWVEAGPYDATAPRARDRLALLGYLTGLGFTLPDLVAAHATGRLFALAGDRLIRPAGRELGASEVGDLLGADPDVLDRVWRAFGLPSLDETPATPTSGSRRPAASSRRPAPGPRSPRW